MSPQTKLAQLPTLFRKPLRKLLPAFLASLAVLSSGALHPGLAHAEDAAVEIRKVKNFDLIFTQRVRTLDPMISFERSHLLHGAITQEEYREREGTYYTVFWRARDRSPGVVLRFEYYASLTSDTIHVKEVAVDQVKRNNTTDITVIGEEFVNQGEVRAWKVSVLRDGEVLASTKSFLWD